MNARLIPFCRDRRKKSGFTLLEMMITLAVFIMLAAAVFGLMSGVLESTSTLEDNQNRNDQVSALNAFLKNKLMQLPARSTLFSYMRGTGDGLNQNGIIFGNANQATVIDAKVQPNGYYTLRITTFATSADPSQPQDARQVLQTAVTADDPTLSWATLMTDLKTLDWKFQDLNVTNWVELWNNGSNPNLIEFTFQPAGDLQPTTMDFWLPQITAVTTTIQAAPKTTP
jgi:prepilin-type N-terminal cleavage/methylation domain-containing protein